MEATFDADFGSVRLHESAGARDMGAEAFTQGSHIHLAPGRGDARSEQGRELIGHELAHVVQQRAGRVPASDGPSLVVDASLEAEADAAAHSALAAPPAVRDGSPSRTAHPESSRGPMQARLMSFADLVQRATADTKGGSGLADASETIKDEFESYTDALGRNDFDFAQACLDMIGERKSDLLALDWTDDVTGSKLVNAFEQGIVEEKAYLTQRRAGASGAPTPDAASEAVAAPSYRSSRPTTTAPSGRRTALRSLRCIARTAWRPGCGAPT